MDRCRSTLLAEVRAMIPGLRLRRLAARVCSERTMVRLIDPALADLQAEHATALGTWERSRALLLGYAAFAKVMLVCGGFGTRQAWRNWDQNDSNVLLRTTWVSGIAIVLVTAPLWLPQVSRT